MRLAIVSDEPVCQTPDGSYYALTNTGWSEMAAAAGPALDELRVCTRVIPRRAPPDGWRRLDLGGRVCLRALPAFHAFQALPNLPAAATRLARALRDCDVVLLRVPNVYPVLGYLLARLNRQPIVVWAVGDPVEAGGRIYRQAAARVTFRLLEWMMHHMLATADASVVVSKELGQKFCGSKEYMVATVSPVHAEYFFQRPYDRCAHPRKILFVGRLSPEKGVATLIDAVDRLRHTLPDVSLHIAGDGIERAALQDTIERRGLQDVVRLQGWVEHGPQLRELYRDADVFCMPSYSEGLPSALIEALAASLPAVVTRAGGMGAMVGDGDAGLVVPPGDAGAMADGLAQLLTRPELYWRCAQHAYEIGQTNAFENQAGRVMAAAVQLAGCGARD